MSYMYCCVNKCRIRYGQDIAMHTFPNPDKEIDRFRLWFFNIGGEILGLDNTYIFHNRRVCHQHFEEQYCYSKNRISKLAVPTLQLGHSDPVPNVTIQGEMIHNKSDTDLVTASSSSSALPIASQVQTACTESNKDHNIATRSISSVLPIKRKVEAACIESNKGAVRNKRIKLMTDEEIKLKTSIQKFKRKMAKSHKLLTSYKKRLALARYKLKHINFEVLEKKMTPAAYQFFKMQLQSKKKGRGRRYTLNQKILALSLYKPSPKGYRFMSNICMLPSPKTLQKLLQKVNISAGMNEIIFENLKKRVARIRNPRHRYCTIIFDEMAISTGLSYDKINDKILGFVDNGETREKQFADHVLVFMIRGVIKKFKQPIAYSFCSGTTKTFDLKAQIKQVISKVQECGLKVVATVCDQGATNKAAINSLIRDTKEKYLRENKKPDEGSFEINDSKIIALYDPPHLIKGVRNNLISKDLHYEAEGRKCIAKWSHIVDFYKLPLYKGSKLAPNLTACHVFPRLIPKMRVKHCTQVFSNSVGLTMGLIIDAGRLAKECQDTADLLIFFDKLFDSVNGSNNKIERAKIYRTAVTPTSPHHRLWVESIKIIKSMKYMDKNGKLSTVPSLSSWVQTLEGFEKICKYFYKKGITSLLLRHFNQDPLKNFFGAVRAHGLRNTMPDTAAFQGAYKTLMVNNMTSPHSVGANCEKDDEKCLQLLKYFFRDAKSTADLSEITIEEKHLDISLLDTNELIVSGEVKNIAKCAALGYCSGWLIKKIKSKISRGCPNCKINMESDEVLSFHKLIKVKDYSDKGWLCYPSRDFFDTFTQMEHICYAILKDCSERNNILTYVELIVSVLVDFSFLNCNVHKELVKNYLIKKGLKFCLYIYIKEVNDILKGKSQIIDDSDQLHVLAYKKKNKQ